MPRTRHDLLVRYVFCRPKAMAIEMRHVLSPEVLAELDLESLALASPSYARPSHGPLDSDLLFTVNLRGPGPSGSSEPYSIYVSLDHQSNPDDLFPLRSHVYSGGVWVRHIGAHSSSRPRKLRFILPLLLAQHPARHTPTRLSDVFALPDRVRDVFGAPFEAIIHVDDLSRSVLDDPVADPGHLALVEITRALLYFYKNPGAIMDPRLARLGPLFDTVLDHFGSAEVEELLSYVVNVFGEGSEIYAIIMETLGKAVKEMYATVADKLRAEGHKAGLEAGVEAGRAAAKAEAVLGVLGHRVGTVPAAVRERVLATTDERVLQRWFDRALTADSVEAVLRSLDA